MLDMTAYWLVLGSILYSWAIIKYMFTEGI